MELDHPPFDAIILGCGLAESIAAASLAHAGQTVLHVDEENYYGADYASLSLVELVDWARARQAVDEEGDAARSSTYLASQRRRYTNLSWSCPSSFSSSARDVPLPDELKKASRGFSLSLAPMLIPSISPLVDTLVASGVSRYSTFRLLESTSIFVRDGEGGQAQRVPGSKEDVFKDKTIGLREKRGLMKVLLWIAGEFEGSPELADAPPDESLLGFFSRAFALAPSLASSLAYALAHTSSASTPALPALVRMRTHLRAVGKFGNSPFLVGQYGGVGEVVQGFARLGAVQGAIYILANAVDEVAVREGEDECPIEVQIKGFSHPIKGRHLIAHPDSLPPALSPPPAHAPPAPSLPTSSLASADGSVAAGSDTRFARLIAIFDAFPSLFPLLPPGPTDEGAPDHVDDDAAAKEKKPDTALLVFPPSSLIADVDRTVQVILMGEQTESCPAGHYVVYLTTPLPPAAPGVPSPSPAALLAPFLAALSPSHPPLFHLSYSFSLPFSSSSTAAHPRVHAVRGPEDAQVSFASDEGARCAAEGERLFWAVFGARAATAMPEAGSGTSGAAEDAGENAGEPERGFFEPRAQFDDGDEWD